MNVKSWRKCCLHVSSIENWGQQEILDWKMVLKKLMKLHILLFIYCLKCYNSKYSNKLHWLFWIQHFPPKLTPISCTDKILIYVYVFLSEFVNVSYNPRFLSCNLKTYWLPGTIIFSSTLIQNRVFFIQCMGLSSECLPKL